MNCKLYEYTKFSYKNVLLFSGLKGGQGVLTYLSLTDPKFLHFYDVNSNTLLGRRKIQNF